MGAKFKIGDRVNWKGQPKWHGVTIVEAADAYDWKLSRDDGKYSFVFSHELKHAPLTIRAGAYYRTRDGRKVGPMEKYDETAHDTKAALCRCVVDRAVRIFRKSGGAHLFGQDELDLISEWVDEPAADAKVAGSNDSSTAGFTIPIMDDEDAEPDSKLLVSISADTSALDTEIDSVLRRLKKLKKKARKLGVNLEYSELLSAA